MLQAKILFYSAQALESSIPPKTKMSTDRKTQSKYKYPMLNVAVNETPSVRLRRLLDSVQRGRSKKPASMNPYIDDTINIECKSITVFTTASTLYR
jgi:hypothetical protein